MKIATVLKPVSKHVICKPVVHQLVICQQSLIHFISISRQDKTRNSCSKNNQSANRWSTPDLMLPKFHIGKLNSIEGKQIPLRKKNSIEGKQIPFRENIFHWENQIPWRENEFDWEKTNSIEGNKFQSLTLTARLKAVNPLIRIQNQYEGRLLNLSKGIWHSKVTFSKSALTQMPVEKKTTTATLHPLSI